MADKGLGFNILLGDGPPKPKPKSASRADVFARALIRATKDGDEVALASLLRSSGLMPDDDEGDDYEDMD